MVTRRVTCTLHERILNIILYCARTLFVHCGQSESRGVRLRTCTSCNCTAIIAHQLVVAIHIDLLRFLSALDCLSFNTVAVVYAVSSDCYIPSRVVDNRCSYMIAHAQSTCRTDTLYMRFFSSSCTSHAKHCVYLKHYKQTNSKAYVQRNLYKN